MAHPGILAVDLESLGIHICGLQEVRHPGSGRHTLPNGYQFIWSGRAPDSKRPHEHGVGALLSPDTAKLLRAADAGFAAINERMMVLRFQPNGTLPMTVIIAYAPTEAAADEPAKDLFYERLNEVLSDTPSHHFLLVLGDFNAKVSAASHTVCPAVGRHTCPPPHSPASTFPPNSPLAAFHHKPGINDNGHRLLDVCAAHNLVVTYSFFPHPPSRVYTWYSRTGKDCNIPDHILVRRPHLSSVRDVRARCPLTRPVLTVVKPDHALVTTHIRFRFSETWTHTRAHHPRPAPTPRYFTDLLRDPDQRLRYAAAVTDALAIPPPAPRPHTLDQQLTHFIASIHAAASEVLGPCPPEVPIDFTLSDRSLEIARNLQAARVEGAPRGQSKHLESDLKSSIRDDSDSHWSAAAKHVQNDFDNNKPHTAHRTLSRLVDRPHAAAAPAVRSGDRLCFGVQAVADAFGEHFKQLHDLTSTVCLATLDSHLAHAPSPPPPPSMPPPTRDEVEAAIKTLKNSSPGYDNITAPLIKHGGDVATGALHRLIVSCWNTRTIPTAWKQADICPLYKGASSGPTTAVKAYRGISLLPVPGKTYTHVLLERLRRQLEPSLATYQFGFRPGRGTTAPIFTLRRLQEESHRAQAPLHVAYVDLSKAFDRVNHTALWHTLLRRGVHPDLLSRIESLYSGATARVRVGGAYSASFTLGAGVKQGCPLSPLLFNIFIDTVIRSLIAQLPNAGIQIGYVVDGTLHTPLPRHGFDSTLLPLLLYADDIALMATDIDALSEMLARLDQICSDLALEINYAKTVHQTLGHPSAHTAPPAPISIPSTSTTTPHLVLPTDKFKYLGSIYSTPAAPSDAHSDLHSDAGILDAEISRRIGSAWFAYKRLTLRFWDAPPEVISDSTKIHLYNAFVVSALLYGCQAWTLNKAHIHRLEVTHNRFLRRLKRIPHNLSPSAPHTSTIEMHAKDPPTAPIIDTINKHRAAFIGPLIRHLPPSPSPQPPHPPHTSPAPLLHPPPAQPFHPPHPPTTDPIFPATAALFMCRRPDVDGLHAGGAITSYRQNAGDIFTSQRFRDAVKTRFDQFKRERAKYAEYPELARILDNRVPPGWITLARFPQLWASICSDLVRAG
jgi:hypothetical protein